MSREVFEKCILDLLHEKTRILVTHQLHFLPKVDRILVMDNGYIVQDGSYKELMDQKGLFAEMMWSYNQKDAHHDTMFFDDASSLDSNDTESIESQPAKRTRLMHHFASFAPNILARQKTITTEERRTGAVTMKDYISLVHAAGGWWVPVIIIFIMMVTQAARVM